MKLTHELIEKILYDGMASHTALGQKFIQLVDDRMGFHIDACYLQSGLQLLIPSDKTIEALVRARQVRFAKCNHLTVWCHSDQMVGKSEEIYKETLYSLFLELLDREQITPDYPRQYLPEEMRYYGWINKRKEEVDHAKALQPDGEICEQHTVAIEFIDHLALWHYLQNSLKIMNRCETVTEIGARVFCGYDQSRRNMAYYIILPDSAFCNVDKRTLLRNFNAYALEKLKPYDKWNAINEDAVAPIICKWSDLSEELRFSLVKG